jgi:hypothetical protein
MNTDKNYICAAFGEEKHMEGSYINLAVVPLPGTCAPLAL